MTGLDHSERNHHRHKLLRRSSRETEASGAMLAKADGGVDKRISERTIYLSHISGNRCTAKARWHRFSSRKEKMPIGGDLHGRGFAITWSRKAAFLREGAGLSGRRRMAFGRTRVAIHCVHIV